MEKTQTRGECQCCGRDQAVVRGRMSKHGYNVEHGYFAGVCQGDGFRPIQVERTQADAIVVAVRADADRLDALALTLRARRADPVKVEKPDEWVRQGQAPTMVVFAELPAHAQARIIESLAWGAERQAKSARQFADFLAAQADKFHGTELRVVALPAPPARIQGGERRVSARGVLVAQYQDGGRVYWRPEAGGRTSWMGTQSWRGLDLAPAVAP